MPQLLADDHPRVVVDLPLLVRQFSPHRTARPRAFPAAGVLAVRSEPPDVLLRGQFGVPALPVLVPETVAPDARRMCLVPVKVPARFL